jgi:hypothetical protein
MFLIATEAFDRVHYDKLFNLLLVWVAKHRVSSLESENSSFESENFGVLSLISPLAVVRLSFLLVSCSIRLMS